MSIFDSEIQEEYWKRRLAAFEALKDIPIHAKLNERFHEDYVILPTKEALEEIIGLAKIIIVNGIYFGDEGKGTWTDLIAELIGHVKALYRGDSADNAAHSVQANGRKLTCHIVPSGIMTGKPCFIGSETAFDPVRFVLDEIQQLIDHNIPYDNLSIGNFHITTPYHRIMDIVGSVNNFSTWSGVAPVHASKAKRSALRFNDLHAPRNRLETILEKDLIEYKGFLTSRNFSEKDVVRRLEEINEDRRSKGREELPQYFFDFVSATDKVEHLIGLYQEYITENDNFPKQVNAEHEIRKILENDGTILLESPQSNLLSNATSQFFHGSTSAQTHSSGVAASSRVNLEKYGIVTLNVHKFPGSSRVGLGDIPSSFVEQNYFSRSNINHFDDLEDACLNFDKIQKLYFASVAENGILQPTEYEDDTGKYMICEAMAIASARHYGEMGGTSKKPRVTGLFDCLLAKMVADEQGPNLVISAMDRGDDSDSVGLTVAYVVHIPENSGEKFDDEGLFVQSETTKYRSGDMIKIGDQIPDSRVLEYCHPVIKVLPGWKDTPIAANLHKFEAGETLPKNVCRVIREIEEYTGFKVRGIGVGKDREDRYFIN